METRYSTVLTMSELKRLVAKMEEMGRTAVVLYGTELKRWEFDIPDIQVNFNVDDVKN